MVGKIESTTDPDGTAVLVVLDQNLLEQVRSQLTKKIAVFVCGKLYRVRYQQKASWEVH